MKMNNFNFIGNSYLPNNNNDLMYSTLPPENTEANSNNDDLLLNEISMKSEKDIASLVKKISEKMVKALEQQLEFEPKE
jgi:hypothetical protein